MLSWKDGEWRGRSSAKWEHTPLEHGIDRQSKEHGVFGSSPGAIQFILALNGTFLF